VNARANSKTRQLGRSSTFGSRHSLHGGVSGAHYWPMWQYSLAVLRRWPSTRIQTRSRSILHAERFAKAASPL